ncbi:MAG TPA: ATP-dependent protease LonB [Firmicutes bacterium]|nr:ATP-dependent protease LonB [Bacillota bacterium]
MAVDLTANMIGMVSLFFTVIIGLYFWNLLRGQQTSRTSIERESRREMERLQRLRSVSLTEPLSEKTRPSSLSEIIGQEEGLRALRAALCGPNPQHVIIYGPPGVGKTAAARVILEEAKRNPLSPFRETARFVEMDATTARFDDRGIADPLIGSVHDPIYQGAGPMGVAGIPQPKPGAVTRAHGGILFIDEIGELHPVQMNKLLKVLEDRKVFLESAYYNPDDPNIPPHIHDIFQNGLPADFRLVGATTRTANDIPPAIRSRCVEVYFRPLTPDEIGIIASNAARKARFDLVPEALEIIKKYATNGRDAVNILQMAGGIALTEGRNLVSREDVEWVVNSGQFSPRPERKVPPEPQVGYVNGLAVAGPNVGLLLEIEATAIPVEKGCGRVVATGLIDEEEIGESGRLSRRKSMARGSIDNVMTVLRKYLSCDPRDYDIHINFPGGIPIDGPSAGIALVTAIYSAVKNEPVDNRVAMTGEVSIRGLVKPVGGVVAKIEAAIKSGARRIIIPRENWQDTFAGLGTVEVMPVDRVEDAVRLALVNGCLDNVLSRRYPPVPLSQPVAAAGCQTTVVQNCGA